MTASVSEAKPGFDFDALLADAKAGMQGGAGHNDAADYANDLDRMINGASASTQDQLNSKNLSNILNNIKDYGPANNRAEQAAAPQPASDQTVDRHPDEQDTYTADSRVYDRPQSISDSRNNTSRTRWQGATLALLLVMLAVISLWQYRTDGNLDQLTSELALTSEQYMKQIDALKSTATEDNADAYIDELETAVSRLNEEMQVLNNRLDELGQQQQADSNKFADIIQTELAPRLDKLAMTEKAIAEVTSSLVTTTESISGNVSQTEVPAEQAASVAVKTTDSVSGKWMVNLGTFSDRAKATRAYKKLNSSKHAALIHETELNGNKAYRLSVGGFDNREQAEMFKRTTAPDLGFANGWVRQG